MTPTPPTRRQIDEMREQQRRARATTDACEKIASWPESKRRQMQMQGSSVWLTAAERAAPSAGTCITPSPQGEPS